MIIRNLLAIKHSVESIQYEPGVYIRGFGRSYSILFQQAIEVFLVANEKVGDPKIQTNIHNKVKDLQYFALHFYNWAVSFLVGVVLHVEII